MCDHTGVGEVVGKVSHGRGVQGIGEGSAGLPNADGKLVACAVSQAVASLVQSAKGTAQAGEQAGPSIVGGGLADGWRVDVGGNHNLHSKTFS